MGEELVRTTAGPAAVLRIAGVFGLDGPPHLGLNRAIAGALRGEVPTLVGEGSGRRNYVYVHDLAAILVRCLEEQITGVHLIAGRSVLSIAEMLQAVCDILLPGTVPARASGPGARDQVVDPSPAVPARRDFRVALLDIRGDAAACA